MYEAFYLFRGLMKKKFLWWKDGVVYQIYPRSFKDSNYDGIGDINGIISKMGYLEFLGIDAVWLSPINKSPMDDFGYDVKCYRGICELFGTNEEFDKLIDECHKRNIKLILDLVLNHTSDHHIWFLESRSSLNNPKRDWYIWNKGKKKGFKILPPNNWLGAFGGSAWEFDEYTREYYLHSFLKEQPDLNWRNPDLKEAVFDELRYWLDKGIDGFRLDVANWYIKDDKLRNNPYRIGPSPRPYEMQNHIYDRNRPETHEILQDFRKLTDSYNERMLVGEVFSEPPANQNLSAKFYGNGENELHLAFDFSFMYKSWSAKKFHRLIQGWYEAIPEKAWPCFVFSNHDQKRSISRYGRKYEIERAKVLAVILMTLRGTPFLYYGEELGMKSPRIKRKDIVDPLGKRYWPIFRGRDMSRTPMMWNSSKNAGFSEGKPWLPLNKEYKTNNVENLKNDPDSILNFYRDLIKIRKNEFVLRSGNWEPMSASDKYLLCYKRYLKGHSSIVVLTNFSHKKKVFCSDCILKGRVLKGTHRSEGEEIYHSDITLSGLEAVVIRITE